MYHLYSLPYYIDRNQLVCKCLNLVAVSIFFHHNSIIISSLFRDYSIITVFTIIILQFRCNFLSIYYYFNDIFVTLLFVSISCLFHCYFTILQFLFGRYHPSSHHYLTMILLFFQLAWVRSPVGGGWLKLLSAMNQPFLNRPEGMSHNGLSDSQNSVAAKLIKKLLSILSYKSELQVFLRSSNKGYESKVSLLPVKARLCILRHPAYPTVQSDGQTVYFELLSHPILSSQRVARDDATLTLDSLEYFFVCLLRYPTTNADSNLISNNAGECEPLYHV